MWLGIETATDRASVAVGRSAEDAVEETLDGARRHAGALLPMIEAALKRRGVALDQVTGVVVSDGPGSFTGLRVGASVGKALARARGLSLWSAPSLMARAAGVAGQGRGIVLAVADALRGDVYGAAFRFESGRVVTELAPGVWRPETLAALHFTPDILVGEVPPSAAATLERWAGRELIGPPEGAPRAAALLGLVALEGGASRVQDPQAWEPVYGRPAEAQTKWEKVHGRSLPDPARGPG